MISIVESKKDGRQIEQLDARKLTYMHTYVSIWSVYGLKMRESFWSSVVKIQKIDQNMKVNE